jgi:poly(3-hydroxybutyrate) depolymerase
VKPHPIWIIAGCATAAVTALVVYTSSPPESHARAANVEEEHVIDRWCANGLEPIEGGGCFAAPDEMRSPAPMVVYLHGRYGPDTIDEEMDRQTRVMRLATSKGYAVLAMHGVAGECSAPEMKDWWCWPSNERNASDAPAFIERIGETIARARERIGAGPNVLLGFSNGGYFAALIAKRALARFDAIAIAHAGPINVDPAKRETPPILLVTADDDVSDSEMMLLDDELTRTQWPHALIAREGGHALPDWDIDSALTFFDRARKEKLPFSPPLATRSIRPRPSSVDDAGTEVGDDGGVDLGDLRDGADDQP